MKNKIQSLEQIVCKNSSMPQQKIEPWQTTFQEELVTLKILGNFAQGNESKSPESSHRNKRSKEEKIKKQYRKFSPCLQTSISKSVKANRVSLHQNRTQLTFKNFEKESSQHQYRKNGLIKGIRLSQTAKNVFLKTKDSFSFGSTPHEHFYPSKNNIFRASTDDKNKQFQKNQLAIERKIYLLKNGHFSHHQPMKKKFKTIIDNIWN